eukprot:scaffold13119_cov141-Skeletonema_dohrnii-CCMP3373.AAC.4
MLSVRHVERHDSFIYSPDVATPVSSRITSVSFISLVYSYSFYERVVQVDAFSLEFPFLST